MTPTDMATRKPARAPFAARVRGAIVEAARRHRLRAGSRDSFDAATLGEWVASALSGVRLVVASNREPYSHQHVDGGVRLVRNPGGLAVALDAVLRATGGTWVAHGSGSADRENSDANGRVRVPAEGRGYTLARQWLDPEELEGYYSGFSNGALWPLCHLTYTRPRFERRNWEVYQAVNRKFAHAILEAVDHEPAVVLLQDYHLALCAKYIKELRPDVPVALFWHIPWPNPEAFRILPWKQELLEGLLANDLVGFHVRHHCMNFLDTVRTELEARVDVPRMAVERRGHLTRVRAFPISTDVQGITEYAESAECRRAVALWRERLNLNGSRVGLGVDRLDYTKGIPERLAALDLLFERHPEWLGRLKFVQVAVPSRVNLPEYSELAERVEAQVAQLNDRWGGPGHPVVEMIREDLGFEDVVALYRLGDFAAVTALHDGMNLVAKEYVAARSDLGGALVLSPFTGAARELRQALQVNPYDTDALADAFHEVLTTPPEDARRRMEALRARLWRSTIYDWARQLLESVSRLEPAEDAWR